jgi:ribosomal protein S18 acetylase RimI-like enzyme
MTVYRAFRNTDPPAIAELWCSQHPQRGLAQPMTTRLLEERVLSQPCFERQGLIVVEDEARVVGFAHAGFGSNADGSGVSTATGATHILMVAPHADREPLAEQLLERSEQYLISRGARTLFGGIVCPANAFYLGLYGGSLSPGVLESDAENVSLFRNSGYSEVAQHIVMQRSLVSFRPVVNRQQIQIRRQYRFESEFDPRPATWWEACTIGQRERVRHRIVSRRDGSLCGSVTFWNMERVSSGQGVHTMGLIDLEIDSQLRRQGLGTYLVGEALRSMHDTGMSMAEVQMQDNNLGAIALFRRLGFQQFDRGYVFRKTVG